MGTIEHSVEIDARPDEVWALLEDVRRLPELSPSTERVLDAPPRLTRVGQRFRQVVRLLGRSYESDWEVVALEPGRTLGIQGNVGYGASYCLTESVAPIGRDRTRLTVRIDYRVPLGPLGRIAARMGVESRASAEARSVMEGIRRELQRPARFIA